jgi:hypothetical protein
MKTLIVMTSVALTGCINTPHASNEVPVTSSAPPSQATPAATASPVSASLDLADLDSMTFDCPKAGLNAAAREAAKVPSQGTYQFSYFKIINDAHHASYEAHFKSNYPGEPELRYCISMYCQQGWDPKTSKVEVTLMNNERQLGGAGHEAACGAHVGAAEKKLQR